MAQGCLKCLKYTMCFANFLCFMCGVAVLSFGVYMIINFNLTALTPSLSSINIPKLLLISGIVITCVSFLGFLGALKENRCLLLTFFMVLFVLMLVELTAACLLLVYENELGEWVKKDLNDGLDKAKKQRGNSTSLTDWDMVQDTFDCCGIYNSTDWGTPVPKSCCKDDCQGGPKYKSVGCLAKLNIWFEKNFLTTGIGVIVLCVIEVLGMCFAMTLFCHISRSGLGYKL
ncbi:leukocyte surface antigen CD53 [Melanotaenia boesemani]|uniref:leukocyte surface antigen CD53 n=1 Tax=Melanotaenia boesemani TaxID=1250792 RepID=UPI001C0501A4|nr:leukocyte surface antigen CD53 [Melanotaenia boesemani]